MDDYYEIVGVDRTASREAIDREIREQLRTWQRRTSTADLTRRQEAERRVQQLGEARAVLLDEEKRRQYDRKLTAFRSSQPPPAPPTSLDAQQPGSAGREAQAAVPDSAGGEAAVPDSTAGTDLDLWLERGRRYLHDDDHHSAAYAARETLRSTPNPPAEAWRILATANLGLGRLDDALFEARRAAATEPGTPDAQLTLAQVHERREEWSEARRAYELAEEAADARSPQAESAHLGAVRMLARSGRTASAVDRLERRFAATPDRTRGGRVLARGLLDASQATLDVAGRTSGSTAGGTGSRAAGYQLGSTAEASQVRRMLLRAREVSNDPELVGTANRLEQQLQRPGTAPRPGRPEPGPRRTAPSGSGPGARPRLSTLAVFALVLALGGIVTCGVTSPVGAVLGHIARGQIRQQGERGDELAGAAVLTGWLLTAIICCGALVFINGGFG